MPYREAPHRMVPRVFADDGGGYARPAKCVHCGNVISKQTLAWGKMLGDPDGMRRPVHADCAVEYRLCCMGLGI